MKTKSKIKSNKIVIDSSIKKKRQLAVTGILSVIGFLVIIVFIGITNAISQSSNSFANDNHEGKLIPTHDTSQRELNVDVGQNTFAFQIKNNEDINWKSCKLTMNSSGLLSNGWSYNLDEIAANDKVIVPYNEFTKNDGTKFDPDTTKAQSLSIFCNDVGNGHTGFNYLDTNN